jgi:uncharacterized protein YukE
MMALLKVNHKVLRDVASAVVTYCTTQDKEMRSADGCIKSMLSSDWLGPDAQEFGHKWEDVDAGGSAAVKFRESLKNFGENLTACANEYENAQKDTYNAANRLPKYLYW